MFLRIRVSRMDIFGLKQIVSLYVQLSYYAMKYSQTLTAHKVIERIRGLVPRDWHLLPLKICMGRSVLKMDNLNSEPDPTLFREGRAHFILQTLDQYLDVKPCTNEMTTDLVQLSIEVGATEIFRLSWSSQVEVNWIWDIHNCHSSAQPIEISDARLADISIPDEMLGLSRLTEYAYLIAYWMGKSRLKHAVNIFCFQYYEYCIEATATSVILYKEENIIFCSQLQMRQVLWCTVSHADVECIQNLFFLARSWGSHYKQSHQSVAASPEAVERS
jgi:hypothetical protein